MAKKKIHELDLLRGVVYVLLVLALGIFIYSFVWGFKNAKETALSGLQISADSGAATSKCADGEMLYGIHNYPFSSVPTEAGAHSKYLDKMPGGNWKCSNICAPADTNKFADALSKLTVGGQKMNVVASKSEFDALVAKSSGKDELLERTMILDVSLQRRGKGCFGPSDDYNNLTGATLAKENTTAADQKKAEEERQKRAEEKASGGTGSGGGEPSRGTAAGDPSGQVLKAPTGDRGGSDSNEIKNCIKGLKSLEAQASKYPAIKKNISASIRFANQLLAKNSKNTTELRVIRKSCWEAYNRYFSELNAIKKANEGIADATKALKKDVLPSAQKGQRGLTQAVPTQSKQPSLAQALPSPRSSSGQLQTETLERQTTLLGRAKKTLRNGARWLRNVLSAPLF